MLYKILTLLKTNVLYNLDMRKKEFRIGQIVEVHHDDEIRVARILNINENHEDAVVTYLDDIFMDLETETVSLLKLSKYEKKVEI